MNKQDWKFAWQQARLPVKYGVTGTAIPFEIEDVNVRYHLRVAKRLLSRRFVLDGNVPGGCLAMRLSTYKCMKARDNKIRKEQEYFKDYLF